MIAPKEDQINVDQSQLLFPYIFTPLFSNQVTDRLDDVISNISPKATLFMAIDKLDDESLIRLLQKKADEGVRVYLLLGDLGINSDSVERLSGRCLIRCGVPQNGVLVLQDMGANNIQGWIISDHFRTHSLELSTSQCDDIYRVFCYLFWKKATHECMEQNVSASHIDGSPIGEIQLNDKYNLPEKFSEATARDVDVVEFGSAHYWSKDLLWNFLPFGKAKGNLLLHLSKSNNLPSIEELCNNNNVNVRFSTQRLRNILITSDGGWYLPNIPDATKVNWAMRIDRDQKNKLLDSLKAEWGDAEWELNRDICLGDLKSSVRFADSPSKVHDVVEKMSIDLEAIEAPNFETFLEPDFEELFRDQTQFDKDRLSYLVEYTARLYPPLLPDNAKIDPLVQQWNSDQEVWTENIVFLRKNLDELEQFENGLNEKIKKKLLQPLIAQQQKVSEFKSRLNELNNVDLGRSSPSHLNKWTNELVELDSEIKKRISNNQRQKNQTRKEIEWEDKCKKISDDISTLENKIVKQEDEIKVSESKTKETEEKLSKAEDNKQKKNIKKELDKCKKREKAAISSFDKLKIELSKLQSQRKELGDHFVHKNDESAEDGKALGIVLGNKEIEGRFIRKWRDEFLPPEGMELYSYDNKRWLVIENLEQIREAKHHASALNAEICAKRGD
ncbi:hypothetical protein [Methanococcoides alaskense]|uniref:Nucleic acid-binding Zn-ribbon protein n=1 Tax=Methanococcoides alaskense TaxID=325778 RepID=A0AA90ZB26_9EURY|nr:hypothetical protein [Methanococcoides alaskense]MDA0525434.1 hypothetical protein [Methanococcoides alaskense]MDR6221633.1 putative nucleic acid-binding Zn-ribbon protein [Methanococcoides alaskense]